MCTVILEVPERAGPSVRVLAVRDEDPGRAWDPLGPWWPDALPGVLGVRDRRAGGAWLAADPEGGRLSVILNRAGSAGSPAEMPVSRGRLVLDDIAGRPLDEHPPTGNFNLVSVRGGETVVESWDGRALRRQRLDPGVHMIAHDEVDDERTARVRHWLPAFRSLAGLPDHEWRAAWVDLLAASTTLGPADDRAIIRDNRPHGYPTLSLLACTAEVGAASVTLTSAMMDRPGHWDPAAAESLV